MTEGQAIWPPVPKIIHMFDVNELDAIHISLVAYKNYLVRLGKEREEVDTAIRKVQNIICGDVDSPEPRNTADYKIWEAKN